MLYKKIAKQVFDNLMDYTVKAYNQEGLIKSYAYTSALGATDYPLDNEIEKELGKEGVERDIVDIYLRNDGEYEEACDNVKAEIKVLAEELVGKCKG